MPGYACPDNYIGGIIGEWDGVPGVKGAQLTLECATGMMTSVKFASFGTPHGQCGTFSKDSHCDAANTTAYVESLCVGKPRCTIPTDPTVHATHSPLVQIFGDPCEGTAKQLAVELGGCSAKPPSSPPLPVRLQGKGDGIIFDFGKEVGGLTTLRFGATSNASQSVSIAYSESAYYWIGGDHSNGGKGPDGLIDTGSIKPHTAYTVPVNHMRGGFRYMHIALATDGYAEIDKLPSIHFTAAPTMGDPSAWANHFYSSDDLLNRIWYGAGYTTQLCCIDPAHGRQWPPPASGWNNSASCGTGETILVDGAKRDRMVWPGDMGVSVATAFVSTGDTLSSRNALDTLFAYQDPSGMLPYVGPPIATEKKPGQEGGSDTYHLWALIGVHGVAIYSPDGSLWLRTKWAAFQRGVEASLAKRVASGLMSVNRKSDWQRGGQGGENCPANMLLFRVCTCAAELALVVGNRTVASRYSQAADELKAAIFEHLWDDSKGAFFDNRARPRALYPQDGNALSAWFNVTNAEQSVRVSDYLHSNWGDFGASSPEWDDDIGNFPGSMEVHAHMAAGRASRAHALMRLQWGYQLAKPESTQSTFWEGYHKDGSFAFQGIYMSNAHGWATGPAAALSFGTLGLRPLAPGGAEFAFAPSFGGLTFCRGRLSFGAGFVDAAWNVSVDAAGVTRARLALDSSHHEGSRGLVTLKLAELAGRPSVVMLNGVPVWSSDRDICAANGRHGCAATGGHAGGGAQLAVGSDRIELVGVEPRAVVLEVEVSQEI